MPVPGTSRSGGEAKDSRSGSPAAEAVGAPHPGRRLEDYCLERAQGGRGGDAGMNARSR